MNITDWAVPGDLDSCSWFGEQFHAVHDRLLPVDAQTEQTADFLMGLTGKADPSVIELGVGTGRIALRLARRGAVVTGVDGSPLMLDVCRAAPHGADLRLVEADIRTWRPDQQTDLVICIGGTVNLLQKAEDRRRTMRVIASAVRPGGSVVIENVDPSFMRSLHTERPFVEIKLPIAGAPTFADARCFLDEEKSVAQIEYRWTEADGTSGDAAERVVMIGPDETIRMAEEAGLTWQGTYADWRGAPGALPGVRPTYVCVFSAPDAPSRPEPTSESASR